MSTLNTTTTNLTAPTTATATADKGVTATVPANPEKPTSDKPMPPTGQADAGKPAGTTTGDKPVAVEPDKPAVLVVPAKPVQAKGENPKAFKARLAAWQKAQGGATPSKPETTPVIAAPTVITAAKPARVLSPKQAALAAADDNNKPGGYDLTLWPAWCLAVKPDVDAVYAARAMATYEQLSKNELSTAVSFAQGNPAVMTQVNVYDVGRAMITCPLFAHTKPDHKCNATLGLAGDGLITIRKTSAISLNPASTITRGPRIVYGAWLTSAGLKKVEAYFGGMHRKVPRWLVEPEAIAAEMAVAAEKAAKLAAKAARSNVPA